MFFRTFGLLLLNLKLCHDCTSSLDFPSTLSLENHHVQSYHSKKVPLIHFFPSNISMREVTFDLQHVYLFLLFLGFLSFFENNFEHSTVVCIISFINPFVPNAPFRYPLETSGNLKVLWCFQGLEKGCIGNKWVKPILTLQCLVSTKRVTHT